MTAMSGKNLAGFTISELEMESSRLQLLLGQHETTIADARAQIAAVRVELDRRRRGAAEPRISDHAILRFIERSMGIDVASIKKRLLSDAVKDAIRSGASAVVVDGVRLRVADNVIVTVIEPPAAKKMPKRSKDEAPSVAGGLADYYEQEEAT